MPANRLGATPLESGGVHFKVWAPNVTSLDVLIQNTSGSWDPASEIIREPLAKDANGYWEGVVTQARIGSRYRFELSNDVATLQRLDPASRDTIESWNSLDQHHNDNASIVVTTSPYPFSPFSSPSFSDYTIYQLHIGSFAGRNDGLNKDVATFADVETKLEYISDLGFTAIELLPVQEFMFSRSWGYNPALFFAPESAYGSPENLQHFVDAAHALNLAVIFDVVYNHAGPQHNSIWEFDGVVDQGGIYFEGGQNTPWGVGPAWWKEEVQQFFYENAKLYFEEFNADGLRFDATTYMNGMHLSRVTQRLKREYPDKYLIAEHLPNHPWVTTFGNFDATWTEAHHEFQRAMNGSRPVHRIKHIAGWLGYQEPWNLVKYLIGAHDDVGDQEDGNAEQGISNPDRAHRYFVDHFGGRDNWYARAKCRLGWALNIGIAGTPMLFMGQECMMSAPNVGWGYWHDGSDKNGDHRFDWSYLGATYSEQMRRLVRDCNRIRGHYSSLRSPGLDIPHEDHQNQVIGIKRWDPVSGEVILVVANMGDTDFEDFSYGLYTGNQPGTWRQIMCTQDESYGGWAWSGNAFHQPTTQQNGQIYINLPKWSVLFFVKL